MPAALTVTPYPTNGAAAIPQNARNPVEGAHVLNRTDQPTEGDDRVGSPCEMAKIGRNDPCPCGSGKKYKRCHLGRDDQADAMPPGKILGDRLDRELVEMLRLFANKQLGKDWFREAAELFDIASEAELELMVPWSYFHFRVDGSDTIADLLRRERGEHLSAEHREWLDTQQAAWLSIWTVIDVVPGRQMDLEDVLTGERRTVFERKASLSLVRHDTVLARVTDFRGTSTLSGIFPRAMPPRFSKVLVAEVRKVLKKAKIDLSIPTLRKEPATLALIGLYQQLLDAMDHQPRPQMSNTDGHPLLLTKDRFRFEARDRKAVEAALGALEGARDEGDGRIVLTRPGNAMQKSWTNTIVGSATLGNGLLAVETNSIPRADALRSQVETACHGMLEHLSRDHSDPDALLAGAPSGPAKRQTSSPEETAQLNRIACEMRDRMNHEWLDLEIPALGGKTPREAARSPKLRKELILLLEESEHREARMPADQRGDVSWMWAELGLDAPRAKRQRDT